MEELDGISLGYSGSAITQAFLSVADLRQNEHIDKSSEQWYPVKIISIFVICALHIHFKRIPIKENL